MKILAINPISFKKRMIELLFDYLFILAYLVLLTNYFADKKIFDEDKDGYANILILKDASILTKLSVIPDLLKGDVVENDHIEYIKARHIKISSDTELETDVDGDKSDNLPVEIKVLGQHIEVYSQPKE